MTKKLVAVAYARYSSDNQREESITAQVRAISEYCERKGYLLTETYIDEAKSATSDNRPNFQRMVQDSAKKLFDVVVVHKLDRFSRNRYDSANYKRILRKNKVQLDSVLENLDGSPESIVLESMLEGMAEYFSANLARETRKGMLENALRGEHTGGKPPYGLKVNPETRLLEIDERTYKAVQFYFESIDQDRPLQYIADQLNAWGYRTNAGRLFTKNSFGEWAKNRKYIGDFTWDVSSAKDIDGRRNTNNKKDAEDQIVIEGLIKPIVSKELFERVNLKMAMRKRTAGRKKAKVMYLLTGKIVCGKCNSLYAGNSYTNTKSKDNTVLSYYKCQGKCGNSSVRKSDIEQLAMDNLLSSVFSDTGIEKLVTRMQELYIEKRQSELSDTSGVKTEIKELETKIHNWMNALGQGINSVVQYIREAEERISYLEQELRRQEILKKNLTIDPELFKIAINARKNALLNGSDDEKKLILQEYVDRIVIHPSDSIDYFDAEITYRVFNGGGDPLLLESLHIEYNRKKSQK